jgi:hypothetical protein
VYSNGNHYDALIGLDSDTALIAATAALYLKGRTSTVSARANVVNFTGACLPESPAIDAPQPTMEPPLAVCQSGAPIRKVAQPTAEPPLAVCESGAPKGKVDAQPFYPMKKGSRLVDGVRKAHQKWRVGISADTSGVRHSRITVPFDYLTEDIANNVYYFIRRSMAGTEPDPKGCGLDCEIVEQLREFLVELRSGTVDAYLSKLKALAKKSGQPGAVPKSVLRGVSYHASGDWCVRMKLRDVFGKEKVANLPFTYPMEKDAGLAYDFAITHYCFVINQK